MNEMVQGFGGVVERLGEEKLQKLERAVRSVFSSANFHDADMRTIAREAEMGFNTIYKYFGGKEGLLFYFVRHWQDELNCAVIANTSSATGGRDKLRAMFATILDYYDANPDVGRILYMALPMTIWMSNETFSQKALTRTMLQVIKEAQRDPDVRADVPATQILDAMMGIAHRAFTMWTYRRTQTTLKQSALAQRELFESGILVEGRTGAAA